MFLEEILLPVKGYNLAESYKLAGEQLKQLGHDVYASEIHSKWDELF